MPGEQQTEEEEEEEMQEEMVLLVKGEEEEGEEKYEVVKLKIPMDNKENSTRLPSPARAALVSICRFSGPGFPDFFLHRGQFPGKICTYCVKLCSAVRSFKSESLVIMGRPGQVRLITCSKVVAAVEILEIQSKYHVGDWIWSSHAWHSKLFILKPHGFISSQSASFPCPSFKYTLKSDSCRIEKTCKSGICQTSFVSSEAPAPSADPARPHACRDCGRAFARRSTLAKHCGRRFRLSSHFIRHRRAHMRRRLYICAGCGRDFKLPAGATATERCPDCEGS
ncbi:hypothetical protein K5549_010554 [Capra hircus]|nr:hypothetical protein K5549_010554 [Capra hircus]